MNRDKSELIRRVYEAQASAPVKDDWVLQVQSDLNELDINFDALKKFKKWKVKNELRKIISNKSFKYLNDIRQNQSKIKHISYKSLTLQKYLTSSKFTNTEKALLFKNRTRMVDVRENFKNKYPNNYFKCELKCGESENQQHLLDCTVLIENCDALYNDSTVKYEDLFASEDKQLDAVKLYDKVLKKREELLSNISTGDNNLVQCTN